MSILKKIYRAKDHYTKEHGVSPQAIRVCSETYYQIRKELYPNTAFDVKTIPLLNVDRMKIVGGKGDFSGFEILARLEKK